MNFIKTRIEFISINSLPSRKNKIKIEEGKFFKINKN